jgi:uncharacterized protein (TIGR00255 family)
MLQSMTGFGKASGTFNGMKVTIEIRTLNSKSFDLYLKVPNYFKEKEVPMRKMLGDSLHRGKVEAIVTLEHIGDVSDYEINSSLAKKYYESLSQLADEVGGSKENLIATVARMPEVLVGKENEMSDSDWVALEKLLQEAIAKLIEFRNQEGESLFQDLQNRINEIDRLLGEVPQYEEERITKIRERMAGALEEIDQNSDANRFEQELIYYIEKLDVSEEKVRLNNHLNYFVETLNQDKPVGKKLGFISQEIGREINTLGSKAQHAELQKIVVDMKDNLEKIKEQVLNTL